MWPHSPQNPDRDSGSSSASRDLPRLSPEQIAQGVHWLCSSLQTQREHYLPLALPLSHPRLDMLSPYFSPSLLKQIRMAELHGARVPAFDFYAQARALGFDNLPEISHMESLTFLDVIVFNEKYSDRGLFHGLVHATQIQVLGLERYAELWIRSFLKTRAHFTVPLEVQAFSLTSKFLLPGSERCSVEDDVRQWAAAGRY